MSLTRKLRVRRLLLVPLARHDNRAAVDAPSESETIKSPVGPSCAATYLLFGVEEVKSRARKLHKRLHTHRTFDEEQVKLNEKAPTCGAFAEPSDGLEPSTPSLPYTCARN